MTEGVAHIILTCAREDEEAAAYLADALMRVRFPVARADLMSPAEATRALDAARAVVTLWSPATMHCRETIRDAERALIDRKHVPVRIGRTAAPEPLAGLLPMGAIDLSDWYGAPDHAGFARLRRLLACRCGPRLGPY